MTNPEYTNHPGSLPTEAELLARLDALEEEVAALRAALRAAGIVPVPADAEAAASATEADADADADAPDAGSSERGENGGADQIDALVAALMAEGGVTPPPMPEFFSEPEEEPAPEPEPEPEPTPEPEPEPEPEPAPAAQPAPAPAYDADLLERVLLSELAEIDREEKEKKEDDEAGDLIRTLVLETPEDDAGKQETDEIVFALDGLFADEEEKRPNGPEPDPETDALIGSIRFDQIVTERREPEPEPEPAPEKTAEEPVKPTEPVSADPPAAADAPAPEKKEQPVRTSDGPTVSEMLSSLEAIRKKNLALKNAEK